MGTKKKKHLITLKLTAHQVRLILSQVEGYSITASAEDWEKIHNGSMDNSKK